MATAPKEVTRKDLQKSYVAASGFGLARGPRRLPQVSDEVAAHYGPSTYEQMACDPEVGAALLLLVYFTLADGVESRPAVGEKDERFELAVEINEHIERTISGLSRPLKETLEMIVKEAMIHGSKVAEKVYSIPTAGPDAFRLVLSHIKVKPKGATAFVVDEFMNLVGLIPASPGYTALVTGESKVISPEKFIIATYRMKDEDPRGNSHLRPAVKPWNVKQLAWPEFLTYLMRCAVPGMALILSENAKDRTETDADGNQTTLSATDEGLQALVQFKNSTAMVLESGSDLKTLEVSGKGEIWKLAFNEILNKEIRKALLLQDLATSDSTHQTKGSTDSQMGIVELLVWAIKRWVGEIVRSQIFMPQVAYNWGDDVAVELTPTAVLGDYDRKDWAADSEAVVSLCTATVLDENGTQKPLLTYSQIQALLTQIGLPAPSQEEVEAMRAEAAQLPPEPNNPPPSNRGNQ
jgi:hypothetical protein